jgi:RNA polymerase sigma factor (sigma-70 family)
VVAKDGFEAWYHGEHPKLVVALAIVARDANLAAEVVDEAFVRAYERWARVGAMASPAGWTYRTALNVLRRRHRRQRLEQQLHLRRAERCAPPPDWSFEVWDALGRLPDRERTAMALRYVADLTTDDIAVAMGVRPGTVGSTLHAARARLATVLAERIEEVTDA